MPDHYQRLEGQETSFSNARLQGLNTASHGSSKWTRTPIIQAIWWLVTVIFCAFILATIRIYEQKGNFTNGQKHSFNTIITGLILALGLNFFVRHRFRALYDVCKDSSTDGLAGGIQVLRQSLEREHLSPATPQ